MTDEERRDYEARMAQIRYAYEQDARGRGLNKKWFVGLVVMWIAIWGFIGTSGILPRPLWVVLLPLMVASAFAVAFLAPRINQSKTQAGNKNSASGCIVSKKADDEPMRAGG